MQIPIKFFAPLMLALASILPSAGWAAYKIDASTFLQLPKHCQAWFAGSARAGKVQGLPTDLSGYEQDLRALLGPASIFMNHYCPALGDLIRLENYASKGLSDEGERLVLMRVLKQMNYQLDQTGRNWNKSNAWFHAEVIKNRAYTYYLLGENQKAINDYSQALKIYPPYLPAYWGLADMYEQMGQPKDALDVLQKAQEYARNKKFAQKIQERIATLQATVDAPAENQ